MLGEAASARLIAARPASTRERNWSRDYMGSQRFGLTKNKTVITQLLDRHNANLREKSSILIETTLSHPCEIKFYQYNNQIAILTT